MRSRLGRRLAAVAAGKLASRLTPVQAQRILQTRVRKPLMGGDQIKLPAEAAKPQQENPAEEPVNRLREAVNKLRPEEAEKLPKDLAVAVLEILGHSVARSQQQPSGQPQQPSSEVEDISSPIISSGATTSE